MLLTRRGLIAGAAGLAASKRKRKPVAMSPDQQGVFPFLIVGGGGSTSGVFVYDPAIAQGDLIASMTAALTSPTGDTTVKGITSYDPATSRYAELNGSVLTLSSTAAGSFLTEPGTVHLTDALAAGTNPTLTVDAPNAVAAGSPPAARIILVGQNNSDSGPAAQAVVTDQGHTAPVTSALLEVQGAATGAAIGLSVTGGETADTVAVSSSQAAGDVLTVTNTHSAPTNPSMQITAQSSGDLALGIEVTGDADERLAIRSNGELDWSSGAAAADVKLNRSGAGVLSLTVSDFNIGTVGRGLQVKTGANAKVGTAALVGGTVSVPNTSVTANSIILLGQRTPGGTPGALFVSAVVVGTSFTIKSTSATDTSTVGYLIVETT